MKYYLYTDSDIKEINRIYEFIEYSNDLPNQELAKLKVLDAFTFSTNSNTPNILYRKGDTIRFDSKKLIDVTPIYDKLLKIKKTIHQKGGIGRLVINAIQNFKKGIYPTYNQFKEINEIYNSFKELDDVNSQPNKT